MTSEEDENNTAVIDSLDNELEDIGNLVDNITTRVRQDIEENSIKARMNLIWSLWFLI